MARILVYDLETSDLRSDWGTTLAIGYKFLGDRRPKVMSIMDYENWKEDMTDDENLIRDFHKIMSQADIVITYYGKGFDSKWLNSKFLQYNLPILADIQHIDLYFVVKSNMNLSRKSLDNVSRFLSLDKKKFYVSGKLWQRARIGDPDALTKVNKHCYADIIITEQLYYKLRPFIRQHPRIDGYWNCRHCGSSELQRRGYAITISKGRMVRMQCKSCSSWSSYPEADANAITNDEQSS